MYGLKLPNPPSREFCSWKEAGRQRTQACQNAFFSVLSQGGLLFFNVARNQEVWLGLPVSEMGQSSFTLGVAGRFEEMLPGSWLGVLFRYVRIYFILILTNLLRSEKTTAQLFIFIYILCMYNCTWYMNPFMLYIWRLLHTYDLSQQVW